MITLWHYTCAHGRAEIGRVGLLKPPERLQAGHGRRLPTHLKWMSYAVWATDLDRPDPDALGLTSWTLGCDRTEFRYRILTPDAVMPWREYAEHLPAEAVTALETAPGAQPDRWWVGSGHSVPVRLDQLVRAS